MCSTIWKERNISQNEIYHPGHKLIYVAVILFVVCYTILAFQIQDMMLLTITVNIANA